MVYVAKEWVIRPEDETLVDKISRELNISPFQARLLVNRGNKTVQEADQFLHPRLSSLGNPFQLPDMGNAILRVRDAIAKQEKILIYGDTDVDGITGVIILKQELDRLGARTLWFIPQEQGYGLHSEVVNRFVKEQGITLAITVDCGISAYTEIEQINALGTDVIVTDHHIPPEKIPPAYAIIDPKRTDSLYKFTDLAGCALAFKFIQALIWSYQPNYNQDYVVLDIETTGLNPLVHEIVEIAVRKIKNFIVQETFHTYVKPEKPIPAEMTKIHGIDNEITATAPALKNVLNQLCEFIGSSTIVAHNAEFDLGFINHNLKKYQDRTLSNPVIDTLTLARQYFSLRSYSLESIAKSLHLPVPPTHRALDDTLTTTLLFHQIEETKNSELTSLYTKYLDLIALGSIADAVPMLGENRIFVRHGLELLNHAERLSVRMLLEHCGLRDTPYLSSRQISWTVTPLLNAAGRLGEANTALEFLSTDNRENGQFLLSKIIALNEKRRKIQNHMLSKLEGPAQTQYEQGKEKVIILESDTLEPGVSGIIANQLVQKFDCPVMILTPSSPGTVRGAARAPIYIDLLTILRECRSLLNRYGGHRSAAGFDLPATNLTLFIEKIRQVTNHILPATRPVPKIEIDQEIDLSWFDEEFITDIFALEPYGVGNPAPTFSVRKVEVRNFSPLGIQGNHLKVELRKAGYAIDAIARDLAFLETELEKTKMVDIIIQIDPPRGNERGPRFLVLDIRPGEVAWNRVFDEIKL